jgi:hypothetical protein
MTRHHLGGFGVGVGLEARPDMQIMNDGNPAQIEQVLALAHIAGAVAWRVVIAAPPPPGQPQHLSAVNKLPVVVFSRWKGTLVLILASAISPASDSSSKWAKEQLFLLKGRSGNNWHCREVTSPRHDDPMPPAQVGLRSEASTPIGSSPTVKQERSPLRFRQQMPTCAHGLVRDARGTSERADALAGTMSSKQLAKVLWRDASGFAAVARLRATLRGQMGWT